MFEINNKKETFDNTNKTLVLYTFHEYNKNVEFFIKKGIFKDNMIDFIIICNNKNINIDVPDYVKIIKRDNTGYDFGGWSEGLLTNDLYKNYNNFIFVNSSVIGPIVPKYYKNNWTQIFIDGLTDDIKLFGCTINSYDENGNHDYMNKSHIQSYVFSLKLDTLKYLISKNIFSLTELSNDYNSAVKDKEIKMSREIINNNWNIGSLFIQYNNIDFRNTNKYSTDIFLNNPTTIGYYGQPLSPYEVIFLKEKYIDNKKWLNAYLTD